MSLKKLSFLFTFLVISSCHCANILYMAIIASPSHHIWNDVIINELAHRGHNVTVISPFSNKNPLPRVHYIRFEDEFQSILPKYVKEYMNSVEVINPFLEQFLLSQSFTFVCSESLNTRGFRTLLNYPHDFRFDLIINDFTIGSCFLPFLHKFNYPPLISVSAYGHPSFISDLVGGHHYYAYVPHYGLPFDDKMSFYQRLFNFLIHFEEMILMRYYFTPMLDKMAKEHFGPNIPSIRELEQKTALALISTNPVMDYVAPLPENVIPVAGVHIKDPKPLPEDLELFLNSSKRGAVIFSLGTNFRSDFIPIEKRNIVLNVFRELPDYNFLWKFESNIPSHELPTNVRIQSWLPQSDALVHRNVKAIFFHGGMLTTQEALWRGLPMIIMPFSLDQRQNLFKTKKLGISEGVDYLSLNTNEMKNVLLKVLQNESYTENAKKWSARFRDQKEKPLDKAIWWIEWILRNPNCDYLKSPVLRLGFIVGNSYDLIATICFGLFLILIAAIKLSLFIIRVLFNSNASKHKHRKTE